MSLETVRLFNFFFLLNLSVCSFSQVQRITGMQAVRNINIHSMKCSRPSWNVPQMTLVDSDAYIIMIVYLVCDMHIVAQHNKKKKGKTVHLQCPSKSCYNFSDLG